MTDQIYSDDIGAITVTGPIVRFDLMIQSPTETDAAGKPKLVVQQRVIMPIDAFLLDVFLRAAKALKGALAPKD